MAILHPILDMGFMLNYVADCFESQRRENDFLDIPSQTSMLSYFCQSF